MPNNWKIGLEFLEEGDIYFYYLLNKSTLGHNSKDNIESFYLKLNPSNQNYYRILYLNSNRLPLLDSEENTIWGQVQDVNNEGMREIPSKEFSAGAGSYAIIYHENKHTHLIYSLEVPKRVGKIQRLFNLKSKGNFIVSLKNPQFDGTSDKSIPKYLAAKPPDVLNNIGNEILFIASGKDFERLGIMRK
jgi:hypothetical protein